MQAAIGHATRNVSEEWGVELAIRIGVNTGEVVAGQWDISGRVDVDITGDVVNTSARLKTATDKGEILVGVQTMRLARRLILYGAKRNLSLKGKMSKVPAYDVVGIRDELAERWEQDAIPFIGRDRELDQSFDAWRRVQAGEGQLVGIVGDAGVGKSRLVAELIRTLDRVVEMRTDTQTFRARCLSHGQETTLSLVADLLRSLLGVRVTDRVEEVERLLQAAVTTLLLDNDARIETLGVVREVLGLPTGPSPAVIRSEPQIRQQVLIRSLRMLLGASAERAIIRVVLEDLHWIDQTSQEVRPGGNPFFVEELVRSLKETGGIERRDGIMHLVQGIARCLPKTLTEILLARPDRLESQVRSLTQVGSVIGRRFGVRLLSEVVSQPQAIRFR